MNSNTQKNKSRWRFYLVACLFGLLLLACFESWQFYVEFNKIGAAGQGVREISLALLQYSQDHDGKYPEGKSSTEILQKLMDNKYLAGPEGDSLPDPSRLYFPMPGKVQAASNAKILKPENVCWDITCCIDERSPNNLPVVFLTGYKVTYQPGASAIPLKEPERSYLQCLNDWLEGKEYPSTYTARRGCKGRDKDDEPISMYVKVSPDGTIPNFIPADFDAKGKTYRQLTPNGELPP